MGRARLWIPAGGAVVLVLAGAVLGVVVDRQTSGVDGCATAAVLPVDVPMAGPDDILLTEDPAYGPVSAHVGQRLVVVLGRYGFGGWVAVSVVDGSAVRLVATVGAYDYQCQEYPAPAAQLAIVRAETSGVATLISNTDAPCRHVRPPCTIAQRMWRRTITVSSTQTPKTLGWHTPAQRLAKVLPQAG